MGALRVAELDEHEMIGISEIYRLYKRGEIFSDDEVALISNPVTLEHLSEPLVNIRFNVKKLKEEGLLSPRVAGALIEIAETLPYPERGYERILSIALGRGILDVTEHDRLLRLFKRAQGRLEEARRDRSGQKDSGAGRVLWLTIVLMWKATTIATLIILPTSPDLGDDSGS
jgi:hypothetical protein